VIFHTARCFAFSSLSFSRSFNQFYRVFIVENELVLKLALRFSDLLSFGGGTWPKTLALAKKPAAERTTRRSAMVLAKKGE
jgi:hypothetical protein